MEVRESRNRARAATEPDGWAGFGADRIHYVHPDCGFWMLPRNVADAKMRVLTAGRDLFEGR